MFAAIDRLFGWLFAVAADLARKAWKRSPVTFLVLVGTGIASSVTGVLLALELGLGLRFVGVWFVVWTGLAYPAKREVETRIWIRGFRRLKAEAGVRYPGRKEALAFRSLEATRKAYIFKQWPVACQTYGWVNAAKVSPGLRGLKSTADGALTCTVAPGPMGIKGGVGALRGQAHLFREVLGVEKLIIKQAGRGQQTGVVRLSFMWEDPLLGRLPIQQLPESGDDEISLGIDELGGAAKILLGLSIMIFGLTGLGKSSAVWTILVSLATKVRTLTYFIDPKGGQEFGKWKALVGRTIGRITVAGWGSRDDVDRIIGEVYDAMVERQKVLFGIRKWEVTDQEKLPLIVLIIDESLELLAAMSKPTKQKLMALLSQGRAGGVQLILLSQLADKATMDQTRTLTRIRISMGMESASDTTMIFGTNAIENGAAPHELTQPGLAYIREEGVRGYKLIRLAHVDDDDAEALMRNGLPDDMGADVEKAQAWAPYWNYRYFSRHWVFLYGGITNDPERRDEEHLRDFEQGDPDHWWVRYADLSKTLVTYAGETREAAAAIETREMRYRPVGNISQNQRNPWRNRIPFGFPRHPLQLPPGLSQAQVAQVLAIFEQAANTIEGQVDDGPAPQPARPSLWARLRPRQLEVPVSPATAVEPTSRELELVGAQPQQPYPYLDGPWSE